MQFTILNSKNVTVLASAAPPRRFAGEFMNPLFPKLSLSLILLACCDGVPYAQTPVPAQPIPIKVVVVTMFERGEDTGDTPGEFQLWVEREHLDQVVPLP